MKVLDWGKQYKSSGHFTTSLDILISLYKLSIQKVRVQFKCEITFFLTEKGIFCLSCHCGIFYPAFITTHIQSLFIFYFLGLIRVLKPFVYLLPHCYIITTYNELSLSFDWLLWLLII